MAYTQTDLDALQDAIKTGVLTVRHSDGRSTTFHSLSEMRKLAQVMKSDIAKAAGNRRRRVIRFYQSGTGL